MRRTTIAAIAVASLAVLVSACSDSGGGSSPTTLPPKPTVEADRARAQRAVLTADDLPGYSVEPVTDDAPDPLEKAAESCFGNDPLLSSDETSNPRAAVGEDFESGQVFVGSSVVVAESEDQARTALSRFSNPSAAECLAAVFRTAEDPEATISDVAAAPLTVPRAGDETAGLRVTFTLTTPDTTADATIDFLAIRRERAVASLTTGGVDGAYPDAGRDSLARKMADRMAP